MSSAVRLQRSQSHSDRSLSTPGAAAFRAVVVSALLLVGFAVAGWAQPATPVDMPGYLLRCSDCIACDGAGTSCFREDGGSATDPESEDGCQSYGANVYENWNDQDPGPAISANANQTNITSARMFADADFWYFQVRLADTTWADGAPVYTKSHIEVAFDADGAFPCSPGTRYSLLITYAPNTAQIGTDTDTGSWDDLNDSFGAADLDFWRDGPGDVDVGGPNNDGPGAPNPTSSDFVDPSTACPTCGGYETVFASVPTSAAFARLRDDGGAANVEIALDRSDFATFLGLADFSPCDARYWQMQTSTLDNTKVAWNDFFDDDPTGGDLSQESWAMDSCGGAAAVPVEVMKFDVD